MNRQTKELLTALLNRVIDETGRTDLAADWRSELSVIMEDRRQDRKCTVPECQSSDYYARGLCTIHYQRWKARQGNDALANMPLNVDMRGKHGRTEVPKAPRVCSIEGCGNAVAAKGMCWKHYARVRRGKEVEV